MCAKCIGKEAGRPSGVFHNVQQVTLNAVREVLPDRLIEHVCRDVGYAYRRRVLTPVIIVLHMILAAIWPEESFAASWQLVWDWAAGCSPALAGMSPSSGSLAKAPARLPLKLWKRLFVRIAQKASQLSEAYAYWRGHRVVLADGTCVSMPDMPPLHEAFGTNTGRHGKGKYPLARLVTLTLAHTMTVLDAALGRYDQAETALLGPLLTTLRPGDLFVGDRHFAAAHFYVRYQRAGLEFLTRAHQRLKVGRLPRIIRYSDRDFLTDLQISPAYRRQDKSLPKTIRVRMIQAVLRIRGRRTTAWFVTSLLDPQRYPAAEIVEVYGRRWRIETLFGQFKVRLSADVLRSQSPEGIRKEVLARLLALNVVRCLMLEVAGLWQVEWPNSPTTAWAPTNGRTFLLQRRGV